MVQLKQVLSRLKSITNIKKITKTMKMVSASKLTRAERELKAARPFGYGPKKFYESSRLVAVVAPKTEDKPKETTQVEPTATDEKMRRILVAMTSDRGLCGGVHSGVSRRIKRAVGDKKEAGGAQRIVCVGDKSRSILQRLMSESIIISVKDVGRTPPIFTDASHIAAAISGAGYVFDIGDIYYNKFHSAVKYELEVIHFYDKKKIQSAPNMNAFDDVEEDQLESYAEWTLAALLFYALKEGAASEQSARMSAMDNATKNADEMIRKLNLLFNRTRQAVITRELIEIISGAAALK